ncbi:hypothetical protein [Butyrivibrio sp. MC2013]|uniref:hypothetical protein n=1 Tax=Butyrivibrio sp. MC2013 TaxID=1280686 RepID=UPI0003F55213|nr:hypothetical protein [Butyrivibrio sp. MC2013]
MKRKYKLSKQFTDEQAAKALEEVMNVTGAEFAEYADDRAYLIVGAEEDKITHVMNRAVNIFARVCGECKISFDSFVYED